jgi:hypothetical protein
MENRILDKSEWRDELIKLWRKLDGKDIQIEVEALNLGDQVEAEYVPLKGLSYDPKDDVVQVWVGALEHMINKPQKIMLAVEKGRLLAVEITDADGEQHLIKPQEAVLI